MKQANRRLWIVLLAILIGLGGFFAWQELITYKHRLSKAEQDYVNRDMLIKCTHVANNDPNVLSEVAGHVGEDWSINEATAQVFVAKGLFLKHEFDKLVENRVLVRNARSRHEFRDPWGKPYNFQIVNGRIALVPQERQPNRPATTTAPVR